VAAAMTDRVAQVDEQIKLRGGEPPKKARPATKNQQQTRTATPPAAPPND
jgi:hypothetical protein